MGLIAGGQEDGAVTLWDPLKLETNFSDISQVKMGKGCVSVAEVHPGQSTNCVQFSPFKKNLLATGGEEVLILDIGQNIKKPAQFKPGVPNHHQGSKVTSISWNCTVPHILASASSNGKIVVWDMKSSKAIFNFTESGVQQQDNYFDQQEPAAGVDRQIKLIWNPRVATEFLVASDNDQQPEINLWDLRNPDYPVATFSDVHYNGITSASWSSIHPDLIVSSSYDARTVITNRTTGQQVLEFPTQDTYASLDWAPNSDDKISAMTTQGDVSILSLTPEGRFQNPDREFRAPIVPIVAQNSQQPRPRVGMSWGFGNKLATFNNTQIKTYHQSVNFDIANKASQFSKAQEAQPLDQLISQKIASSESETDKAEYQIMLSLATGDNDLLFKHLGIDKKKLRFEIERTTGKKAPKI